MNHPGFRGSIARSTLADANERRDCRIFEEFALHLIGIARRLYADEALAVQLEHSVYAIDASTIDLCLSLFSWAPAAKARAGVKLHTLLDLRGNIPSFIRITSTLVSTNRILVNRLVLCDRRSDCRSGCRSGFSRMALS